jgi:hypothetical protein
VVGHELGDDGAGEQARAIVTPPTQASRRFTARWRLCATTPERAATKTCTIVTAATDLTSSEPRPVSGGT